ncbi:MAG: hypothetical protein J6Z49_06580 [Kiritimatiellae bacterium]|nr:hypothetical protein [Kiritimatiellia bacterium]
MNAELKQTELFVDSDGLPEGRTPDTAGFMAQLAEEQERPWLTQGTAVLGDRALRCGLPGTEM